LSEAVFATDAHGMLTHVNSAWARLSGHGEQDSIGKALADFFIESDRRGVAAFLGRLAQGTAIRFDYEGELERAEGGTVWVELRAAPFVVGAQDAAGVCGVLRDAAERKRAATELEDVSLQLLLLVDESDVGILIEDVDGMIRQVNPAFCALFGIQAAPFSFEGSATAEMIQGIEHAFADVDDLLTHMARIRAAAEDVDNCEVALSNRGIARLAYRAVAENGPARGHVWIFRMATASACHSLESLP
jgi:PAS domain S-box-containing protein